MSNFKPIVGCKPIIYNHLRMIEYAGILIIALFSAMAVGLFLFLTSVLGPKRPNAVKNLPFECGEKTFGIPQSGISVHFYLLAMLFIIFDVELVFLFPWAVLFRHLGVVGLIEISVFVAFILVGYIYALKKGALDPK